MVTLAELQAEGDRLLAQNRAGSPTLSTDPAVVADAFARGDAAIVAMEALRDRDTPKLPPAEKAIRLAELRIEILRWRGISGPKNVRAAVSRR